MTERRTWRAARPVMGAAAALALGGCAATHVGEDWQCPLAQGAVCASVAAADPAVPGIEEADDLAMRTPLYRAGEGPRPEEAAAQAVPERRCAAGSDPLAWLAGLFAGGAQVTPKAADGPVARAAAAGPGAARPAMAGTDSGLEAAPGADPSRAGTAPEGAASPTPPADPAPDTPVEAADAADTAPLPAPEDPSAEIPRRNARSDPAGGDAGDGALRTGEVIGRVWIAPFVDAGGIYREGSWVRVVIAPAEWRMK